MAAAWQPTSESAGERSQGGVDHRDRRQSQPIHGSELRDALGTRKRAASVHTELINAYGALMLSAGIRNGIFIPFACIFLPG